jgi:hypothetical protein
VAVLLHACNFPSDSGGDELRPPQTEILDVRVQPDTVAPGDTASLTCVIEDSLDERFLFRWDIDKGEVLGAKKENNFFISEDDNIRWIAPSKESSYLIGVIADNGSEDSLSAREGFTIVVE